MGCTPKAWAYTLMTLGEKQRLFSRLVSELIAWIYDEGYQVSLGDAYRDPRVFGKVGTQQGYGRSASNHKSRLAIDLNLFRHENGKWVWQQSTEAHRIIGLHWETMHELCQWGGHFGDGNHYSFRHEGRR